MHDEHSKMYMCSMPHEVVVHGTHMAGQYDITTRTLCVYTGYEMITRWVHVHAQACTIHIRMCVLSTYICVLVMGSGLLRCKELKRTNEGPNKDHTIPHTF